jgi:hypothetical protein
MAIVSDNDLTLGLRGRVGRYLVFRTFGGKTIVSHTPRKPDPRKQSNAQQKTRATFKEAAAWAVQTLRDPEQRRYFEQRAEATGLTNAYTAAVQQRMRWSSGLDGDRISIGEKPVIDEKPKSPSVVRVPINFSMELSDLFRQRSFLFPASRKSRKPILNPTDTHPVVGHIFLKNYETKSAEPEAGLRLGDRRAKERDGPDR